VFPVTIPTEQMENKEKLRSSSWIWPVSLTSINRGSLSLSVMLPFSSDEREDCSFLVGRDMTKALRDGFPLISRRNGGECLFELATAVGWKCGRGDSLLISGRSGKEQ
jgi:hypothetical protein